MDLTEKESTRDLRPRVRKLLRDLLKPVEVRSVTITKSDRYTVRGVVLTECPIERRESGRDFEVGLDGKNGGSIQYVSVDGRRLIPRRTRARAPRKRTRTPRS